ncbi:MAG: hypothetical protein HYZ91_02235 [Candidatus Omnitrophica bacterium]|nr:hypothetical protein [Candidatus Omnitrophota bacterium]
MKLDYRGLEALLVSAAERRTALGLRTVPDHSMLHWFARHKVMPTLLKQVRTTSLRLFTRRSRRGRRIMALDATGFSRRPASRDSVTRLGHGHWAQRFSLASTVIWTTPQVICAQEARVGPGSQSRLLQPLVEQTQAVGPIDRLLADADYARRPRIAGCAKSVASRASFLPRAVTRGEPRPPLGAECSATSRVASTASAGWRRPSTR